MVSVASHPSAVPVEPRASLAALCEQYRRHALTVRSMAAETVGEELLYLRRFFASFGPQGTPAALFGNLVPKRVSGFLVEYAAAHGPGSRRWMQISLRSFLRFAYDRSYLDRDLSGVVPSVRTRRMGRVPRVLPDACIAALQTGIARDTAAGLRDAAIVCLLSTYGVRGVQIRRLRLDHLDWRSGRIHFPAAKGGRPIEQHLTPEAGNRLAEYLTGARPPCSDPEVFLTLTEPFRPLPSASHLSAVLHRRMEQLGVRPPEGVSRGCHGFRHAFAGRMVGRVPFKDVVDQLGHRDPGSTLVYGKIGIDQLRQAALPWPGGD
jgi:integrase/recombinase XerD